MRQGEILYFSFRFDKKKAKLMQCGILNIWWIIFSLEMYNMPE